MVFFHIWIIFSLLLFKSKQISLIYLKVFIFRFAFVVSRGIEYHIFGGGKHRSIFLLRSKLFLHKILLDVQCLSGIPFMT